MAKTYTSPTSNPTQATANRLWALLALPAQEKETQFLKLWDSIKQQKIEDETFISIMGIIDSPAVQKAVAPHFLAEKIGALF